MSTAGCCNRASSEIWKKKKLGPRKAPIFVNYHYLIDIMILTMMKGGVREGVCECRAVLTPVMCAQVENGW